MRPSSIYTLTGCSALITVVALWFRPAFIGPIPNIVLIGWSVLWVFRSIQAHETDHRLHHLSSKLVNPDEVGSEKGLVIGRGFQWTRRNTAQMRDLLTTYDALPVTSDERGGTPALHACGVARQSDVAIPWSDLYGHLGIQGATRVGKTEMLRVMLMQFIRLNDGPVVVIDPKGSLGLVKQAVAGAEKMGRKVALICPMMPTLSGHFDPLSTCRSPVEVAERIRTLFGHTNRPFFIDQPVHSIQLIAHMQQAIGQTWTLKSLYRDVMIPPARRRLLLSYLAKRGADTSGWDGPRPAATETIQQTLSEQGIDDLVAHEVLARMALPQNKFEETHGGLALALSGLIDTDYAHLFEPGDDTLTWNRIVKERMVVVVLTASLLTRERGNKLGRLVLQDLIGYAGQRYLNARELNPDPITVICDEFGEATYPGFLQAINKLGEASVRFALAWQSEADLMGNLSREGAQSLLANIGQRITLRLSDHTSALDASRSFGDCEVMETVNATSMSTHGSETMPVTTSRREVATRTPLAAPEWFRNLPKGEAYALLSGAAYKLDGYLLETPHDQAMVTAGYGALLPLLHDLSERDSASLPEGSGTEV